MKLYRLIITVFLSIFFYSCEKETTVKTAMVTKAKRSVEFVDNSFTGAVTATTQTKLSFKVGGNIKKI